MKIPKKILKYAEKNFNEVAHTTLNPDGPGVVRIHLIPPEVSEGKIAPAVVILNGQDIIPINYAWAIMLIEFIREINKFHGHELTEADTESIKKNTVRNIKKISPFIPKKMILNDIATMMEAFTDVAYGRKPKVDVGFMTIGEYAPNMRAPHRMDLLVSAMEKEGRWNCNQKCVHCYAAGQSLAGENELSTEEWKNIIDKCRRACIPQLTFTGGEPTMREDLAELIEYAAWFVTRLNTNGIKLTEDYCKKLRNASLDSCQITFYSENEDIHNRLVGEPFYKSTVKGIENALSAGLNISINTPLCRLNSDYVKTLEFLHEKGVEYVTCSGLITTGNALSEESENLQLSSEELTNILRDAVKYCAENKMEISFTSPGWIEDEVFGELGISRPTCGACLSNMAVTPGGNVVPCQSYLSEDSLGSMLSDDWDKIWNCERCRAHREFSAKMTGECPLRRKKEDKS